MNWKIANILLFLCCPLWVLSDGYAASCLATQAQDNRLSPEEENAVYSAIRNDDVETLRRYLDAGLPVDYRFDSGRTLLRTAPWINTGRCGQLLIERGAEVDIYTAATIGDIDRVKQIIGEDKSKATAATPGAYQPIWFAARRGHTAIVKLLVEHGASLQASTDGGMPIHAAVNGNHLETVRALVEMGSSFAWKDTRGLVPANYARSAEMLRLLFELGVDPAYQDDQGRSLLNSATLARDVERVKLLLSHDLPQAQFDSALLDLATNDFDPEAVTVAEVLLAAGANVDARTEDGATGVHIAVGSTSMRMCKFFLEKGVDPNVRNDEGETALHWAAGRKMLRFCRLLVEHGASWDIRDDEGKQPRDLFKAPPWLDPGR